jgi:hypothetical protein
MYFNICLINTTGMKAFTFEYLGLYLEAEIDIDI